MDESASKDHRGQKDDQKEHQQCQMMDHMKEHRMEAPILRKKLDSLAYHTRWREWKQQRIQCVRHCEM